ncbi:MAG: gamma carbonic anhydrase family protein, partial [Deltaproteobacteria bacterium]
MIRSFKGVTPDIDPSAFIAETAVVIGAVQIGPYSSVWYNCVLRGDVNFIRIGAHSNIQDLSVLH